ncbi:hypothetical protein R6Q57_022868 [Mikania cordata]
MGIHNRILKQPILSRVATDASTEYLQILDPKWRSLIESIPPAFVVLRCWLKERKLQIVLQLCQFRRHLRRSYGHILPSFLNLLKKALWNPVTGSYKLLSTHDLHGFFEHNADAVGLYIDAYDDYKVLHIKRRFGVFDVNTYSRRFESWRNIPFLTRSKYVSLYFSVSFGTFCVDTLYFTVCDCWIGGENVLICFNVNSEIFKEITFPPLASAGMTFGDLVNIKNELYMFVSTGIEFKWIELWMLEDDHWIKSLLFPPIPPIPLGLFCEITHFMTNGN